MNNIPPGLPPDGQGNPDHHLQPGRGENFNIHGKAGNNVTNSSSIPNESPNTDDNLGTSSDNSFKQTTSTLASEQCSQLPKKVLPNAPRPAAEAQEESMEWEPLGTLSSTGDHSQRPAENKGDKYFETGTQNEDSDEGASGGQDKYEYKFDLTHSMKGKSMRDNDFNGSRRSAKHEEQSISTASQSTRLMCDIGNPQEKDKPWTEFHLVIQQKKSKTTDPVIICHKDSKQLSVPPVALQYLWLHEPDIVLNMLKRSFKDLSFRILETNLEFQSLSLVCSPQIKASTIEDIESDMDLYLVPCVQDIAKLVNFNQSFHKAKDPDTVLSDYIKQGQIAVFHEDNDTHVVGMVKDRRDILNLLTRKTTTPIKRCIKYENSICLQLLQAFDIQGFLRKKGHEVEVRYDVNSCSVTLIGDSTTDTTHAEERITEFLKGISHRDISLESDMHAQLLNLVAVHDFLEEHCYIEKIRGTWTVSRTNSRITFYFENGDEHSLTQFKDILNYILAKKVYLKRIAAFASTTNFQTFIQEHENKDLLWFDNGNNLVLVMLKQVEEKLNDLESDYRKKKDISVQQSAHFVSNDIQSRILLRKFGFKTYIKESLPNAEVDIQDLKVSFSGITEEELRRAIAVFCESQLCHLQKDFPCQVLKFVKKPNVAEYIDDCIEKEEVLCHWFVDEGLKNLYIYARDQKNLNEGEIILKKSIHWEQYGCTPDFMSFFDSQSVKTFFNREKELIYSDCLKDEEFFIVGVVEVFNEFQHLYDRAFHNLNKSTSTNESMPSEEPKIYQASLGVKKEVLNYFRCYKSKEWNEILSTFNVKVDIDSEGNVLFLGDATSVKDAASLFKKEPGFKMMKWSCNVVYPEEVVKELCKEIPTIEKEFQCLLEAEKDSLSVSQQQLCQVVDWFRKTNVVLIDANEYEMAADVVVVPTNESYSPSNSGEILLAKGGSVMKNDFSQKRVKENKEIYLSPCTGNLPFQMVAYLAVPGHRHGTTMQSSMVKCIKDLFETVDKAQLQSLVIPLKIRDNIPEATFLQWFCSAYKSVYAHLKSLKQVYLCTKFSNKTEALVDVIHDGLSMTESLCCYDFRAMFEMVKTKGQNKQADITVNLVKGSLVQQKVDVIVNSCNSKLELTKGAVSSTIISKGGQQIQRDCNDNWPKGIPYGFAIKTSAGKMNYKFICHGSLPFWTPGTRISSQLLQKLVFECLSMAGVQKCKSIAFPVFGTGNLEYPWDEVAEVMIDTVKKYGRMFVRQTTVKEVTIVLYEGDPKSVKAFEERKRLSEEISLDPEDTDTPPSVILESRCDDTRVQVIPLKDTGCHHCEAFVKILTFGEVLSLQKRKEKAAKYSALNVEGIFTRKKDTARCWFIDVTSDGDKKNYKKVVAKALEFAAKERLSSVAICMRNPEDIEISFKKQAMYIKEAVIEDDKNRYLVVVKVICPDKNEFDVMVKTTKTKQEEESKTMLTKVGEFFSGNKHQWKCVNNIGCVQSPRILLTAIADNEHVKPFIKQKIESKVTEILKQNADFMAVTIREERKDTNSRWVRIEKTNDGGVRRVALALEVCKQIDESMNMNHPNVEIKEGNDVYCYNLGDFVYSVIGKDYMKGDFYKGEPYGDKRQGFHPGSGQTSRQNSYSTDETSSTRIFEEVIGDVCMALFKTTSSDKLLNIIKKKCPSAYPIQANTSGILTVKFKSLNDLLDINKYLKESFKIHQECVMLSGNQKSTSSDPIRPERKKKKTSLSDEFEILNYDLKKKMEKELYEKILFFSSDNRMKSATYENEQFCLKLETSKDYDKYEQMLNSTIEEVGKLSQVEVSYKDFSKAADVEKMMKTEFDTVFYKLSGNLVQLFSANYDILQHAKHRVDIVVGNKQESTGRRNRRFADPTGDYTRSKDDSSTYQKQLNTTSQSLSRTVGGASMSMEQVFTTTGGIVVKVYVGNILQLDVDCIVNAANENLMHGGGVAAAISSAAGYEFDQECSDYVKQNGVLLVGTCCSTSAGNLQYKNVIHTVGPRWSNYRFDQKNMCAMDLRRSIICCFEEAEKLQLESIALPSISAGIFGVPKEVCVAEYSNAVTDFSHSKYGNSGLKEIHFIDKDFGLISLIQNEFSKTLNLSSQQGSIHQSLSAGKPYFKRSSQSAESNSTGSTNVSDDFRAGGSFGGSRHDPSKKFNRSTKKMSGIFVVKQKIKVEVKIGNITKCEVDAIVCPQDEFITNAGAIAKEVINIAGFNFRSDISKLAKINKTGAQRMNAPQKCPWKYVIQAVPPRWNILAQRENQKFEVKLKETVMNILNATKFSRIKTIALPLIGVAEKGYDSPVKTFGEQFVKALLKQMCDKDLTVEEIQIVVQDPAIASTIRDVLESHEKDGIQAASSGHRKSEAEKEERMSDESKEKGDCCICIDELVNPKKLSCGHVFCTACIEQQFQYKPSCPQCGASHGIIKGTQPKGRINILTKKFSLSGYEGVDTIVIEYEIYSGVQGNEHPEKGRHFEGIKRTAYLPANKKGRMISKLLKVAFDRRLIFTIGTSTTTGKSGVVTWNDIHHKTNPNPFTQFGYPDQTYLDRVLEELAVKGVTEKDLTDY